TGPTGNLSSSPSRSVINCGLSSPLLFFAMGRLCRIDDSAQHAYTTCNDGAVQLAFGPNGGAPRTVDEAELIELYRLPAPEGRGWLRPNFGMSLYGSVQGPDGRPRTIKRLVQHTYFACP